MRRFYTAVIVMFFFIALLVVPINRSFVTGAEPSEGEKLAAYSKPAVVRIIVGPEGMFTYQDPSWPSARNFAFNYVISGSGFFISSNGYIATNAHVSQMWHEGEDKAKQLLISKFIFAAGRSFYNIAQGSMTQQQYDIIRGRIQGLSNFNMYHFVVIPDGTEFPFEDKPSGYGAPTGESENAKDVSVIKIEVKNAPVLILGDSDQVKVSDTDTVIGYPGVANIDHGNSGGPVLNDKGLVIGLATFGKDSQHSFVVTSNTALEFVKSVNAANELGLTDKLYREGLDLYWQAHYKEAMPKFEEVKRLFPQHSEVNRLIQSSQQAITEGKDKSGFGVGWLVGVVLVILFIIVAIIVIAVVIFLLLRRRGKSSQPVTAGVASPKPVPSPAPSRAEVPRHAPAPYSASPPPASPPPVRPSPYVAPGRPADSGKTVDLSATIAITRESDTAPMSYGTIQFVSGVLNGQKFEVKPEGCAIGRDGSLAQIVITDPRISKRHLWIGVREGRVAITDEGSRNGTFLNDPKSPRVTEAFLSPGDTVILGESDVARFEYQM